MTLPVTPIDLFLLLLWLMFVYLCARRGLIAVIVGAVALVAMRPLLLLIHENRLIALPVALLTGLLVGILVRPFPSLSYRQPRWGHLVGALSGILLASAVVLSLLVSLPVGRTFNGTVVYPARDFPLSDLYNRSPLVSIGRAIVLYPLVEGERKNPALRALHTLFVVGEPWKEDGS